MKHIFCAGYGAPTVIHIKESPLTVLKPDELLLRIHATSITGLIFPISVRFVVETAEFTDLLGHDRCGGPIPEIKG
jgi:hypothetical protein